VAQKPTVSQLNLAHETNKQSMSLHCNETDSRFPFYNCRQYFQQQQQQLLQQSVSNWTSFYRMYHQQQHLQHAAGPMSTSPYLDYCNAVLPACCWSQLSSMTTNAAEFNGGWNQHPARFEMFKLLCTVNNSYSLLLVLMYGH